MLRLRSVVDRLDGASDLRFGPNADFEKSTPDYTHGFIIQFNTADDLAVYATDAEHQAIGADLVAMSAGGKDGISVFDLVTD